ncbi:sulfurtransferase TusA family protein [Alkalihalobacterium chitinilyticum]|uniref:Sulfurtransferase TusA family protein n=1 Tax=Alkalihalobacterium chitinilyticum TaxID=2980103 RepID=A0ABT5VDL7_9BACI|nr:rhodanese-like domain-containing protein [Alkalihalobacterium chitinilyticum]MDE5413417.1 sulfurtransferase TusA family protein [Alkalihalobacterium chitinilyticum]
MDVKVTKTIDIQGEQSPVPVVHVKKALSEMDEGEILEVVSTEVDCFIELKEWASYTGHEYMDGLANDNVFVHYIRKGKDAQNDKYLHPRIISNDELISKIQDHLITVLDVREELEFEFKHIPGSVSIPLGELKLRLDELAREEDIYVICRTGNRSDFACHLLEKNGFKKVWNVIPGISHWNGPME